MCLSETTFSLPLGVSIFRFTFSSRARQEQRADIMLYRKRPEFLRQVLEVLDVVQMRVPLHASCLDRHLDFRLLFHRLFSTVLRYTKQWPSERQIHRCECSRASGAQPIT